MNDQKKTDVSTRFAGQTVLITGGGTGMGRAAALRFGHEGANVVVAGRRENELNAVVHQIKLAGGSAYAIPTDISVEHQVMNMVDRTIDQYGGLHMVWNNAGILGDFKLIHEADLTMFDQIIATNLKGIYTCLKYQIAAMIALDIKGAIVNTSSWTATGAVPGTAAYAASKAALDAITRTVSVETGERGIRINNVSPGIINTPMSQGALGDHKAMKPFELQTSLRRIGQPEDVANMVVWLLSQEANFITGQSILVDGGFTLGGVRPWINTIIAEHG